MTNARASLLRPDRFPSIAARYGVLQRRCTCGTHTLNGECTECSNGRGGRDATGAAWLSGSQAPSGTYAARLAISQPGDRYEVEADQVAEAVMRSEAEAGTSSKVGALSTGSISRLQRLELEDVGDPEEIAMPDEMSSFEEAEDEEDAIVADETGMPKGKTGSAARPPAGPVHLPTGSGQPLDATMQAFMGRHLRHDFSGVRIHTGTEAVQAADRLEAQAFTVGHDIYFNEGRYRPDGSKGRRLLAHELVHVVQQNAAGGDTALQRQATRRRRRAPDVPPPSGERRRREPPACSGDCAASRAPRHDGCNGGSPAVAGPRLTDLRVLRGAHRVIGTWSDGTGTDWPCSPSTRSGRGGKVPTPLVTNDHVGIKCDSCHTNRNGDGMGWFTGFATRARAIGFHNSQRVGPSFESHGCVRVSCAVARAINQHSSTGVTTINVVA